MIKKASVLLDEVLIKLQKTVKAGERAKQASEKAKEAKVKKVYHYENKTA